MIPDGSVERPDLGSGDPVDAFAAELDGRGRGRRLGPDGPGAVRGSWHGGHWRLCHAEVESVKTGKVVNVG